MTRSRTELTETDNVKQQLDSLAITFSNGISHYDCITYNTLKLSQEISELNKYHQIQELFEKYHSTSSYSTSEFFKDLEELLHD